MMATSKDHADGALGGPVRSRRMLLAGAAGGLGVLTAEALARPAPAAAANGDNLVLGSTSNTESSVTEITNTTDGGLVLLCFSTGSGVGVSGQSDSSVGTVGNSASGAGVGGSGITGTGVVGVSGSTLSAVGSLGDPHGVHGITSSPSGAGVLGENDSGGNGVYGHANNSSASGVYGQNDGTGFGVAGRAISGTGVFGDSADGVGVWASSQNATALKVTGKAHFSRSGKLVIAAGKTSATKTAVALSSASLVLVTPQNDVSGVAVRSAVPDVAAGSFTVHLAKAVSKKVTVGWFVVN